MNCKSYITLLSSLLLASFTGQKQYSVTFSQRNNISLIHPVLPLKTYRLTDAVPSLVLTGVVDIATIPARISAPLEMQTLQAVKSRIDAAGDLTLDGATINLPDASASPSQQTLVVRNLKLSHGSIITKGHQLTIVCETLEMDAQSMISSYVGNLVQAPTPASNTIHGAHGRNGIGGGTVYLYFTKQLVSPLTVTLPGQGGGHGGSGQDGAAGQVGERGRSAHNGSMGTCMRGPGVGKDGGAGSAGGNAGNSGSGGAGGSLWVNFVNVSKPTSLPITFEGAGGLAGQPGRSGQGGVGGQGGLGGSNAGNCTRRDPERNRGANGPAGTNGQPGIAGQAGAPGTLKIQELVLP